MARRVGQVLVAMVAIVAVGILARPSLPEVPPPFEIERATPTPRPSPTEPVDEAPDGEDPDEDGDPETTRERFVAVHRLDPQTLVPLAEPWRIPIYRSDLISTAVTRDGRYFALVQQAGWPEPGSVLQLYRSDYLDVPLDEFHIPVVHAGISFSADSRELVWAGQDLTGEFLLGGISLRRGTEGQRRFAEVPVSRELLAGGIHPLGGGRVGLQSHAAPDGDEQSAYGGTGHGPVHLTVADLTTGTIAMEVTLPTAPAVEFVDDEGGLRQMTAGIAWDGSRNRAYVAHADRDAVLVVELDTGQVVTELTAPGTPQDTGGARPAEATGRREARWREARLSPDGAALYVSGTGLLPFDASGDHPDGRAVELPLLVADLEAGELAVSGEVTGRVVAISGDGATVVALSGLGMREPRYRLQFLDGASLERRWEHAGDQLMEVSFTPDGSFALILSTLDAARSDPGYVLDVFDVAAGAPAQTLRFYEGLVQSHLHAGIVVQFDHTR